MPITIDVVVEYNDLGFLMQSTNFIGHIRAAKQ